MGLKATFKMPVIQKKMDDFAEGARQAIVDNLIKIGKLVVAKAREEGAYNNWTNNLRSSVGFVVVKHGNIIHTDFKRSGNGTVDNGDEGQLVGEILAIDLAKETSKNEIVLIVVAGMNYAAYVESRGKDVLSSSEHYAEQLWGKLRRDVYLSMKNYK